jgi:site-specific DNA-methyltransferase (adenine-specific)
MIELLNTDCMEYMKGCADKSFDLAIVDPPYGLGEAVVNSGGRFKRYENKNGNWDSAAPTEEYFSALFAKSKNQIIWGGNYFALPRNKCFIVWDKQQPEGVSFSMCEYAWTSFESVAKIYRQRTQGQPDRFHPTQKPTGLYEWLLKNYAKPGQRILDTHLGSGSSAIAAHYYGVDFVGMEIDKDYYDAAVKRFNDQTAQMAMAI